MSSTKCIGLSLHRIKLAIAASLSPPPPLGRRSLSNGYPQLLLHNRVRETTPTANTITVGTRACYPEIAKAHARSVCPRLAPSSWQQWSLHRRAGMPSNREQPASRPSLASLIRPKKSSATLSHRVEHRRYATTLWERGSFPTRFLLRQRLTRCVGSRSPCTCGQLRAGPSRRPAMRTWRVLLFSSCWRWLACHFTFWLYHFVVSGWRRWRSRC